MKEQVYLALAELGFRIDASSTVPYKSYGGVRVTPVFDDNELVALKVGQKRVRLTGDVQFSLFPPGAERDAAALIAKFLPININMNARPATFVITHECSLCKTRGPSYIVTKGGPICLNCVLV
jgi:hypothetical protein